jgi:hypothetical protein
MTFNWSFYPQTPTDPVRNPISAEFFSSDALGNVSEGFVREAVQNTLDARLFNASRLREPATVRIFISEESVALVPSRVKRWFETLWPHVLAPGNGLRDHPDFRSPCPYLVYEDFGTVGLAGDPGEHKVIDGVTNHFLNFFRAEGHSDKGERDRGSWGIGKTIFPRASGISSFFGLTVRNDDHRHLLMGRSILKYHTVEDGSFKSDGYFGVSRPDGFMMPCDDAAILAEFSNDFRLMRQDQPGLSIVVPWYDQGEDDSISWQSIVAAVLNGFFYPILMGSLAVTIATPTREMILNAGSIIQEVESLGGIMAAELLPLLKLAEWAQTRLPDEFQTLLAPAADRAQKWTAELVPPDVVSHIRQLLERREHIALRVPMSVQKRGDEPQPTFFNIFLERSDEDTDKPLFIRDELIIPEVKCARTSQVRALVIIEDAQLATLLRDAETPAHTHWSPSTAKFKNRYKFGPGAIDFVRHGVSEVLRIVSQADQKPDPSITIDYFSIPSLPEDAEAVPARRRRARREPGVDPPPQPPRPPRPPRRFRIDSLRGGFRIIRGDSDASPPKRLRITAGYDIRRGNPLRKYHPADFDLGKPPINCISANESVSVESAKGQQMCVLVTNPDFRLDVTGFDPNRDVYVRAVVDDTAEVDHAD